MRPSATLRATSFPAWALLNLGQGDVPAAVEEQSLDQVRTLDRFLVSVEKRAFRIARIAVRNDDDALDIVQDAMLQLARRYAQRPAEEWRPLFYRILQNRIRDCQRRRNVRARLMSWLPGWKTEDDEVGDPYEGVVDARPEPQDLLATDQAMAKLERALGDLPRRQQEAFMLRNFEGMDVAQTAAAMGCSEGSVKTHYSRAVHTLRERGSRMVNAPDPLEERSRDLFDESVDGLDARTRSRLNQARQRALAEMNKGSARRYWLGAPLGGLAAAALIALILIRTGGESPSIERSGTMLDDFDIVADGDNFELIQDVEFYSWLANRDDGTG